MVVVEQPRSDESSRRGLDSNEARIFRAKVEQHITSRLVIHEYGSPPRLETWCS